MDELGHKQQQVNVHRHIEVQYYFVRKVVEERSVDM